MRLHKHKRHRTNPLRHRMHLSDTARGPGTHRRRTRTSAKRDDAARPTCGASGGVPGTAGTTGPLVGCASPARALSPCISRPSLLRRSKATATPISPTSRVAVGHGGFSKSPARGGNGASVRSALKWLGRFRRRGVMMASSRAGVHAMAAHAMPAEAPTTDGQLAAASSSSPPPPRAQHRRSAAPTGPVCAACGGR